MVCYGLQKFIMEYVEWDPFHDIELSKSMNNCHTIVIYIILKGLNDLLISGDMVTLDDPNENKRVY